MQKPVIWVAFKLNQQYIYENFCEQKDKPITVCGGNCKLQKINQQQEERQEKMPELNLKEITLLPGEEFVHSVRTPCRYIHWLPFIEPLSNQNNMKLIFHPPKSVLS